jgi:hypothetical protein
VRLDLPKSLWIGEYPAQILLDVRLRETRRLERMRFRDSLGPVRADNYLARLRYD